MAAKYIPLTGSTSQLIMPQQAGTSGPFKLCFLYLTETDGTTTQGKVNLRDGLTASGTLVQELSFVSPASTKNLTIFFDWGHEPIMFSLGIYLEHVSGNWTGTAYVL